MTRFSTVLFDLDGTLLPIDIDEFLVGYIQSAYQRFKDLMPLDKFASCIKKATYLMIDDVDPESDKLTQFGRRFEVLTGHKWVELRPRFDEFYASDFPLLKSYVRAESQARKVVEKCLASGMKVVLATNSVFPEAAVRERMKWCGVDDLPWMFVANMENMHYCKPHLEYYTEIGERLGLDFSSCVMVGNDVQEDMIARDLGMKTYLAEGPFVIDRGTGPEPDWRGKLEELPDVLGL